jgi:hypothetical protein
MMERKSLQNPFDSDVVTSPEQPIPADVAEIHEGPFKLCSGAYEKVAAVRFSWSVLLHGEAGCGKTHVLSRFRRWLSGQMGTKPSQAPALFVPIRMETAPSQIWRHIRRRFAQELAGRASDGTYPLDGILSCLAKPHPGGLTEALDAEKVQEDLARVLESFAAGLHRRLCRAWLAGDGLSDADLQILNLYAGRPEEIEEEFGEDNARRVVLAIIRLAAPSPVVFCFDQVEALGIAMHGAGSYGPFGRVGAALVDETRNVLLVSTILTSFLPELQRGSMVSDYQRISKDVADLHPLDLKQGWALIDSRLALIPGLKGEDPISHSALRVFYEQQHNRCNARRLIHEARRLFAEWQECAPSAPVSTPEFLQAEFERLWAATEARSRPEMADAVLAHGLPVALQMLGRKTSSTDSGLTVEDAASRVDVVFINHSNMASLAGTLRRLLEKRTPGVSLRLVRDRRLPISPKAKATRERLKKIEEGGGRFVRVEAEALAALDAMRQLLTAATSGDLSSSGEAVEEKTVREWLRKNLPSEVQRFAAELLGEAAVAQQDIGADGLLELVGRRKVVSVDEAARATSWPKEKIEDYARTHPLDIRWFGGSCPVVCLAVAAASTKDTGHAS